MTSAASSQLPPGLLLAYYGDDFTGSTDAMEAMTVAGIPTMLFFQSPTPEMLARFPSVRCVGLAGASRGKEPAWMEAELTQAFDSLQKLGAPILQYKVCSTFDSSPAVGSIGKAIDLGAATVDGAWIPIVVGVPQLKRYQAFGNLFAAVDGQCHRLDRHPTMSRHPVTPMAESDLRVHLAQQTQRPIDLVDLVQLTSGKAVPRTSRDGQTAPAVFIDVVDESTSRAAGELVWEGRGKGIFTASSSGLQYALTAYWRSRGWIPSEHKLEKARPVPVIAGVSGSCSPVTAKQLEWAEKNGFATIRLEVQKVLDKTRAKQEIERVSAAAIHALSINVSPIIYSARGPDDPAVLQFSEMASQAGLARLEAANRVSDALAQSMRRVLDATNRTKLRRVAVAGGDSSGDVASALDITALTVKAPLTPGAPLCQAWSESPQRDGLEIVLKGGQMGNEQFFGSVLAGS
ncbi:3-oxo-isoapionate kinase OiaK [Cupriavidus sp. AcVe19-6a]|uniref:3-oxo-isoapionate kinase OiaK n=1 Tax=Cupriavidus sp. AcVe19-6a TaxID=2821358 RepID=UPI001AEB880F|nr:3-oxo-isoapionate kinase OiaK [Cupriavidus sp. AcVe19-6a]MBP0637973.1 four-carbon acid sugar kinase family protein [Cupriavidus sp. AcVe19-6a]